MRRSKNARCRNIKTRVLPGFFFGYRHRDNRSSDPSGPYLFHALTAVHPVLRSRDRLCEWRSGVIVSVRTTLEAMRSHSELVTDPAPQPHQAHATSSPTRRLPPNPFPSSECEYATDQGWCHPAAERVQSLKLSVMRRPQASTPRSKIACDNPWRPKHECIVQSVNRSVVEPQLAPCSHSELAPGHARSLHAAQIGNTADRGQPHLLLDRMLLRSECERVTDQQQAHHLLPTRVQSVNVSLKSNLLCTSTLLAASVCASWPPTGRLESRAALQIASTCVGASSAFGKAARSSVTRRVFHRVVPRSGRCALPPDFRRSERACKASSRRGWRRKLYDPQESAMT